MMEWILIGFTWTVMLVGFAMLVWTARTLRDVRSQLARQREAMEGQRMVIPLITFDEDGRVSDVFFNVGPVPEGELRLRIPIMRGLGKMTMEGDDEHGEPVLLLVDFEAGLLVRATDADRGLPSSVPAAFHQAFDG